MNDSQSPYQKINFTYKPSASKLYLYLNIVINDVNYPYFDEVVDYISSSECDDYSTIALWLMVAHNPSINNEKLLPYALKYANFNNLLTYYAKMNDYERKQTKIEIINRGLANEFILSTNGSKDSDKYNFYKDLPPEYQLGVIL